MDGTLGGSWAQASTFKLAFDGAYFKAAEEATAVYIGTYAGSLFVAFIADQQEPITATDRADGTGVMNDDAVMVHLWPDGLQGYAYWFATNPNGARDQSSSENSAYAPNWVAYGHRTDHGYIAELQIPLAAIRTGNKHTWRAQFHRIVATSGANFVWELDVEQKAGMIDPRYAGSLVGVAEAVGSVPTARVGVYGLGEIASAGAGGSTSRLGGDFSVPVSRTISAFGTVHPDYSNVEIDQQSIAPTEFSRRFSEVRPFFTQAAAQFNLASDFNAPNLLFYSPGIPDFKNGAGLEGAEGSLTFSTFDASGYGRNDDGQAAQLSNAAQTLFAGFERISADITPGGLHDDVSEESFSLYNPHGHTTAFINYAAEVGSLVTDPAVGKYEDLGVSYQTQLAQASFALQEMGAQFNPIDGYANQPPGDPGIKGYTTLLHRSILYSPTSRVLDIWGQVSFDEYHGASGTNQRDLGEQFEVDFKDLVSIRAFGGTSALAVCAPTAPGSCGLNLLPFNGSGVQVSYAQNTSHPSSLTYTAGAYYQGYLSSWQRIASIPFSNRAALNLEADTTAYRGGAFGEQSTHQWLERASVNYQVSKSLSVDFGARKIVGWTQPFAYAPLGPEGAFTSAVCGSSLNLNAATVAGCPLFDDATNVSAALHYFRGDDEFYLVYGNPNNLLTAPALFIKLIRYIGSGKGT